MANRSVGVISDSIVQQHHLRGIAEACGFIISDAWLTAQFFGDFFLLARAKENVDIWLVDIDSSSLASFDEYSVFELWLYELTVPVILGEGKVYNVNDSNFGPWSRLLTDKLLSVSGQLSVIELELTPAKRVWVLAASTGGLEFVKEFLDLLPTGLELALIYVQHIDSQQNRALAKSIARNSGYKGQIANHGDVLCVDTVTVVPSNKQLDILTDGTLAIRKNAWRGAYRPSIDHIVASVAVRFGEDSGVIYFSGMGDDGIVGARLMSRSGGNVWIQTPSQCTADSMPNAINATGCVKVVDAVKNLAIHLQRLQKEAMLASTRV
jgi:chemosensory pili system protein ChpB (putative protein-glutamate methylesterase)